MTMSMHKAFNTRMMKNITIHSLGTGSYDSENNWVDGTITTYNVLAVIKAGNKFSQFDEGKAKVVEDGGFRISDYRSLYIPTTQTYQVKIGDYIEFKGLYFNVLQRSDEDIFGFDSYIVEKSENWKP